MNCKSLRIFALTGMAVLLSASLALAQAATHDHGSATDAGKAQVQAPAPALTPEQQAKFDKIMSEHQKKTHAVREDMWAKQTELNALSVNPNTKPERISQLVAELKTLRAKQYAEREALNATLKKEGLPQVGMGMGRMGGCGMMGGKGMKHGMGMMGGMGMMNGKQMMHNPAVMGGRMQKAPSASAI
ncbi:periplasmic heavy metal sensor [Desulfocurvibacter africanus]|uniref:Zinc resistance-associated protein n=1 Tax=Desulfocurvibacter africanus subsp. africanus str. Walvis Bay TaxID=690850 RepID=F3YXY9_DESAF|nr:periplasmic heavy metal sensor [Desulfocurvibacter africanus]EGJ50691.1 zinc resistance-associated protein [Desulfocurvibacter africanus subsp. africanus str. Walvis Bay]